LGYDIFTGSRGGRPVDGLEFISSVIGSLAWPATVIAGFFLLKHHLPALFPFVERLKYKDFELEFRKSLRETTEKAQSALPEPAPEEATAPKNRLYTLAEISPRSAILEAWLDVETAAVEALQAKDVSVGTRPRMMAPLKLGELLNRHQMINGAQLEIFHRLRDLRNKAVHLSDATFHPSEVIEYVDLAASLATQIRKGTYGH
jgi:hypothetical protein